MGYDINFLSTKEEILAGGGSRGRVQNRGGGWVEHILEKWDIINR